MREHPLAQHLLLDVEAVDGVSPLQRLPDVDLLRVVAGRLGLGHVEPAGTFADATLVQREADLTQPSVGFALVLREVVAHSRGARVQGGPAGQELRALQARLEKEYGLVESAK